MSIFQAELYDKVHKKVMSDGPIEEMVKVYNMVNLAMGGDYEVRPHERLRNGREYTFDVVFVNKTDEVHMNLNTTLMGCLRYVAHNQGTKNGCFGKYAGGKALVGIFCIEKEVLVYYCYVR